MAAIIAITDGSPKRSAGAWWPSMMRGRVTSVKVATPGRAGYRMPVRRTDAGWPHRQLSEGAVQFSAVTRRPMPTSWVSQTTVSVRTPDAP
jgi:hypothetical protein